MEKATLNGHSRPVMSVAFSPDGQTLASGSDTIKLWDLAPTRRGADGPSGGYGAEKATLKGHSRSTTSVAFSPDGQTLASGSDTIKLWDVASCAEKTTLDGHSSPSAGMTAVWSLAFSPDGRTLASGNQDHTVSLWDLVLTRRDPDGPKEGHGAEKVTLEGHSGVVWSVAFSPDGQTLTSGSSDGTIKLWESASGTEKATLRGHLMPVSCVAYSPDGQTLASGSLDQTLKLWDLGSGAGKATLTEDLGPVWGVAFSPDGQTLASSSRGQKIRLWDVASRAEKATLNEGWGDAGGAAFSPDGQTLASCIGSTIRLWDTQSGAAKATLRGHRKNVRCLAFSPDGQTLASGGSDHTVKLWDVASTGPGTDGPRREYDVEKGTLRGHSSDVHSVAFSPDGQTLASGSRDRTINLWDLTSGAQKATLKGHSSYVFSVAFSPDGQTLASGRFDHTVKLWDVASARQGADGPSAGYGAERATLKGHSQAVKSVAFSLDGKTLASGSGDYTVRLWDLRSAPRGVDEPRGGYGAEKSWRTGGSGTVPGPVR